MTAILLLLSTFAAAEPPAGCTDVAGADLGQRWTERTCKTHTIRYEQWTEPSVAAPTAPAAGERERGSVDLGDAWTTIQFKGKNPPRWRVDAWMAHVAIRCRASQKAVCEPHMRAWIDSPPLIPPAPEPVGPIEPGDPNEDPNACEAMGGQWSCAPCEMGSTHCPCACTGRY